MKNANGTAVILQSAMEKRRKTMSLEFSQQGTLSHRSWKAVLYVQPVHYYDTKITLKWYAE